MERLVIDTDVMSFYFKNDTRFADYAPALDGKQLVLSFMTLAELYLWQELRKWGANRRELMMREIRERYIVFPADRNLCQQWAIIKTEAQRMGRVLNTADAWVAATAVVLSIPLVTHNAKDFNFLPQVKIVTANTQ